MKKLALALTAAALLTGCIVKDTTHTLYMERNGSVSWSVLETDIRSDAESADERRSEEQAFVSAVRSGEHDVVAAFEALSPLSLDSRLARNIRPFAVWTEARFSSLDVLGQTILDRAGIPGTCRLWQDGDRTCFELLCYPGQVSQAGAGEGEVLAALAHDVEDYRLVLAEGRFVEARGFRLAGDNRVAIPVEPDDGDGEGLRADEPFILALTWTATQP